MEKWFSSPRFPSSHVAFVRVRRPALNPLFFRAPFAQSGRTVSCSLLVNKGQKTRLWWNKKSSQFRQVTPRGDSFLHTPRTFPGETTGNPRFLWPTVSPRTPHPLPHVPPAFHSISPSSHTLGSPTTPNSFLGTPSFLAPRLHISSDQRTALYTGNGPHHPLSHPTPPTALHSPPSP